MYTIDKKGNTYSLIDCSTFRHNGSLTRHKREASAFCKYSILTYGYVSHWVFGTDFLGRAGLDKLKVCVGKLQRKLNKLGLAYIMVFEEGEKSKHWHVHTLCDKYVNIEQVREWWVNATKIPNVHINITTLEPEKGTCSSNARLAQYINKSIGSISSYINKQSSNYPGERFFRKSNNVSLLIKPFLDDNKDGSVKLFLGKECMSIDPFEDAVNVIAQMSGYDIEEVKRRLFD